MKRFLIFLFPLLLVFAISCDSDNSNDKTEDPKDPVVKTDFISFTFQGKSYSFECGTNGDTYNAGLPYGQYDTEMEQTTIFASDIAYDEVIYTVPSKAVEETLYSSIILTIEGNTTGTFTFPTASSSTKLFKSRSTLTIMDGTTENIYRFMAYTLNVTSYGAIGEQITGTFSGELIKNTMYSSTRAEAETLPLTDGKFSVKHIADPTTIIE